MDRQIHATLVYVGWNGMQLAAFGNWARDEVIGFQIGGLLNLSGELEGLQLGALNLNGSGYAGFTFAIQIGGFNYSRGNTSLQMGIFNLTEGKAALQIGLFNFAKENPVPFFPGINLYF